MDREKLTRELLFHIRLGEDSSIEFKTIHMEGNAVVEPNKDKIAHEIAAFANGKGGRLVMGVDDKTRDLMGVPEDKASKVEEWLVNVSQQSIHPPVNIDTCLLQLPDAQGNAKTIICVDIPRSIMVHSSAGRYYQRVGSTKQEMKPEVLARLFQQRSQSRLIRFDEIGVPRSGLQNIDSSLKQRFLKTNTPEQEQFYKLHLTASDDNNEENLSVTGVLLLTEEPTQWLSNAYIQCVAYSGTERYAEYQLDAADFRGALDQQINGAFEFVRKNMRTEAVKRPGRIDIPQYHLVSVYEAIVNAVAHRDYSQTGSKIRVHMFIDRLEIFTPGALPNSLTISGLMENTVTRNETIVNLLSRYYEAHPIAGRQALIERRGEGVPTIMRESKNLSGQEPEYRLVSESELLLTIYAASKEKNGLVAQ
jgi:ATP-dependent DNA helicase RecG